MENHSLKIKDLPPDARPREAFMRSAEPGRVSRGTVDQTLLHP